MPEKKSPPNVQQTAIGDGNIQIVGDQNVVNQTIAQRIINVFRGDTEAQRAMRNRRAMLELVKNTWIKGVLEQSLYNEVLIQLGMEERPDAINHPWDMQVQMPGKVNRILPGGTSMIEVFDAMNGTILILGEPGSGKTTMLLELARDCIERAQQDDTRPTPIVFNLSSWDGKQDINDWLVNELRIKYNVSKKIAQNWVEKDELQLLLDGLDEVKLENREACVEAINDYRQEHGLTVPIAVCSRISDYEALTAKLNLSSAILLQSLTSKQIDEYFEQAGSEISDIHQILKNDDVLLEMAKQPLILSIMTLAYQGKPVDAIAGEKQESVETRRKHLFDTYIQQMFGRVARTKNELYKPQQTQHWLSFLADIMIEHNQIPYIFENMQLGWFIPENLSNIRKLLLLWLTKFASKLPDQITGGTVKFEMGGSIKIEMVDTLSWDWKQAVRGLIGGLKIGLVLGIITGLVSSLFDSELDFGFLAGMINVPARYDLIVEWVDKIISILFFGLISSLIFLPFLGPAGFFLYGLRRKSISQTSYPGQRLSLTKKNSFIAALIMGGCFGVIFGSLFILFSMPSDGFDWFSVLSFIIGFLVGFIFGSLIGWLSFGGNTIMLHYQLRRLIERRNLLPFRIVPFLDYCVDRIFLRRVGGGYIFVHRLLMEHFAAMYTEENLVE